MPFLGVREGCIAAGYVIGLCDEARESWDNTDGCEAWSRTKREGVGVRRGGTGRQLIELDDFLCGM